VSARFLFSCSPPFFFDFGFLKRFSPIGGRSRLLILFPLSVGPFRSFFLLQRYSSGLSSLRTFRFVLPFSRQSFPTDHALFFLCDEHSRFLFVAPPPPPPTMPPQLFFFPLYKLFFSCNIDLFFSRARPHSWVDFFFFRGSVTVAVCTTMHSHFQIFMKSVP